MRAAMVTVAREANEDPEGFLIHSPYRAAEWRHKAIELAGHELLQYLDETAGLA
ncbi:MAG TPA: hypothetical protein VII87_06390 [Solirubrobacteraceae bacterium]